jgi:hypothetical protein
LSPKNSCIDLLFVFKPYNACFITTFDPSLALNSSPATDQIFLAHDAGESIADATHNDLKRVHSVCQLLWKYSTLDINIK